MEVVYSVIVPLKNEAENIDDLVKEIYEAVTPLEKSWELIFIDDGSTDETRKKVEEHLLSIPEIKLIAFDKNYGQSSAFDAGFKAAKGQFVITLDGDGQNDPKDIPALLTLALDADLVCGYRKKREDSWVKKITSKIANAVRSRVCGDGVRDTGCSLKVYRSDSLRSIKMYQGMHRFLPALFLIEGFLVKEAPVNHRRRMRGKTKYNFLNRSLNTVVDMLAVLWMRKRALRYQILKRTQ